MNVADESCGDCPAVITLQTEVAELKRWRERQEKDMREVLDVIAQFRMLSQLSIGGGAVSLLTLVVMLVRFVAGNP